MKRILIGICTFLTLFASTCLANVKDGGKTLNLRATIPGATKGVSIIVNRVHSSTDQWVGVIPGDALKLDFGLQYDSSVDAFVADYYYVVDVGVQGGAGAPEVTFHYVEGSNPNAPGTGLGARGSADFKKMTVDGLGNESENPIPGHPKTIFSNIRNKTIASELIEGGWLRVFLGLNQYLSSGVGTLEFFSIEDAPGAYDGTMTITAVVK